MIKNITRADLAATINKTMGLSISEGYELVDLIFEEIAGAAIRGEEIKLQHFGTFRVLEKRARVGRNPKTNVEHVISARRVISFKPAPTFKSKVANG